MCDCKKGIGRKSKSSKMAQKGKKRRRSRVSGLNSKDMTGIATSAVLGGAGAVIFGMILDKVLPEEYTKYTHYAKILGGVGLAAMSSNKFVQAAGLGAATVGAAAVVQDLTDGTPGAKGLPGVNLLRPGTRSYGIAGNGDGSDFNTTPEMKVKYA